MAFERDASSPSDLETDLIEAGLVIARRPDVARVLYVSDRELPGRAFVRELEGKLVHAVSNAALRDRRGLAGERVVLVPPYAMDRQDKLKLAVLAASARGHVQPGDRVIGLVGQRAEAFPDTMLVLEIEPGADEPTMFGDLGGGPVAPSVFEAIVDLAVELGVEGWEGHALGALFVIGDVEAVMARSRRLTLNPFAGYSEVERNLVDPAVRDALRGFAALDGGFVVRGGGVVVAAGRYLESRPMPGVQVPLGLGARHVAAAQVSAETSAVVVVVS